MNFLKNSNDIINESDVALIQKIATGDEEAFDALYDLYDSRLFHKIFTIISDRNMAEEVKSDVWLTIWRSAHTFSGGSPIGWLLSIARNKALDEWRRNKSLSKHVGQETEDNEITTMPDQRPGPEGKAMKKDQGKIILMALERLSLEHREALELLYFQGLKYEEMAEHLDIPLGTVKTRVLHAKKSLKETLKILGFDKESLL